jgi:hypothetical protein
MAAFPSFQPGGGWISYPFLLHHHGSRGHATAERHIAYPQSNQIAAAQLAVNRQIEQCQFPLLLRHLQADPNGPDLFELQRAFLADQLALVPRSVAGFGFTR